MDQDTYVIEIVNGQWVLRMNGRILASFDDLAHAERAARVAMRMSFARGNAAEIKVRDGLGEEPASQSRPARPANTTGLWSEILSIATRILRVAT